MSQKLKYISRIRDEFDSVICGINGVFMFGDNVDKDGIDTLIRLYQDGKKIVLASNSALRVNEMYYVLKHHDIPMNIFHAIITAGELAHFYLKGNNSLGHTFYNLSSANCGIMLGLDYKQADSIVMADFILAQTDYSGLDEKLVQPVLEQALHLRLPMIGVGNNTSLVGSAGIVSGVGAIAERYAMMGGKVISFGKPDVKIASYLTEGVPAFKKDRCILIGDCMATDMRMANNFGVKSLLLTNGVHQMGQNTEQQLADLSGSYGLNIDYYAEALRW